MVTDTMRQATQATYEAARVLRDEVDRREPDLDEIEATIGAVQRSLDRVKREVPAREETR